MSEVKVNKISPRSGTTVTLGDSGDTIIIPSGVTLANSGTFTNFQSTGIDDNATSTAITIDSSENVALAGDITTGNNGSLFLLDNAGQKSGQITTDNSTSNSLQIDADPDNSASDSYTAFRIDNSEKVRIDSSGNVGIGTSSPEGALNISRDNFNSSIQTVPTNYSLTFDSFGATGEYGNQIGLSNGTNILSSFGFVDEGSAGATGIYFTTGNSSSQTERLRISNNGNVGIGTTSPDDKLHVADSTSAELKLQTDNANNGSAIKFNRSGTDYSYIGTKGYFTGTSDNNLYLRANSGLGIQFYTNGNNQRMLIDSSGNVGIGTSSPISPLTVNSGSNNVGLFYGNTGNNYIEISDNNNTNKVSFGSMSGGNAYLYSGSGKYTALYSGASERMRIDSSGKVGIGTSSPNRQLTVQSTTNAEFSLTAGNSSKSQIFFADTDDTNIGRIEYEHTNNAAVFWTNDAERMRIDSSGRLVINATNPDTGAIQTISHDGNSTYGLSLATVNTSGTQYHQRFLRGGTGGTMAGYITSNSATTIAFNNASDERLKENIQNSNSAIQDLKDIQVRQFDWKDNIDTHRDFGFVAQELVNVVPEAVTQGTDELDDNGKPVRSWGVDYSHIVPRLVKVCQEQQTKIEELEARITTLEANNP